MVETACRPLSDLSCPVSQVQVTSFLVGTERSDAEVDADRSPLEVGLAFRLGVTVNGGGGELFLRKEVALATNT